MLQPNRTESRHGIPTKDSRKVSRKGWYLVGGVSVPHDQFPVLRGTYQQPGEKGTRVIRPSFSLPPPPL